MRRACVVITAAWLGLLLLSSCAGSGIFDQLAQGEAVQVYDVQAIPAVEAGLAKHWYPQALATVVLAVDRSQTDEAVDGWRSLRSLKAAVGMGTKGIDGQLFFAAMAYGLEGERFSLREAAGLLAQLQEESRLVCDSFAPAVVICYESQALAMKHRGRSIEIVVPQEGTLCYEAGLLSNAPLAVPAFSSSLLHENAARVKDYTHFSTVCQDVTRTLRRDVLRTRRYSSADSREHQLIALLFMVLVVVWTAAIVRRTMQKGVRRAVLATGGLLLGWIIVRLIKYQISSGTQLDTWLWYAFYLFQLALPLVLLWLAWAIDQPEENGRPPRQLALPAALNASLALLVFTNGLHEQVFRWNGEHTYRYGWGYYLVLFCCAVPALAALAVLLTKSRKTPKKSRFLYPLGLCALLILYGIGYLLRIPPAWESDLTLTTCMFTLLFMEAAARTGMIPLNTKYTQLFTHSPLAMQIVDHTGRVRLASANITPQALPDEDILRFRAPITGGYAEWQEDISTLGRLHRETQASMHKLELANSMLVQEEKIKRNIAEEDARSQLMAQLEGEIAAHTTRLSGMIAAGEHTARIALLLCYIKRRCNLFFYARESHSFSADDLAMYIDELAELAHYAGVRILPVCQIKGPVALRTATLFYDFFYSAADWGCTGKSGAGGKVMLAHLGPQLILRLLLPKDTRTFQPPQSLADAIADAGGSWAAKDLDDAAGIHLSFPEGGQPDA